MPSLKGSDSMVQGDLAAGGGRERKDRGAAGSAGRRARSLCGEQAGTCSSSGSRSGRSRCAGSKGRASLLRIERSRMCDHVPGWLVLLPVT